MDKGLDLPEFVDLDPDTFAAVAVLTPAQAKQAATVCGYKLQALAAAEVEQRGLFNFLTQRAGVESITLPKGKNPYRVHYGAADD